MAGSKSGALQDWLKGLSFEVEVDSWLRVQVHATEQGHASGRVVLH